MSTTRRTRPAKRVDDILARRRLFDVDSGKGFTVWLGRPRRMRRDWECPFHIGLPPNVGVEFGHGIDAFQALSQSLEGIRTRLEQRGRRLSWRGGDPGDAGFPRVVPMFYGRSFSEKVNKLIDDEVLRFARNAARAAGHDESGSARPKVVSTPRKRS